MQMMLQEWSDMGDAVQEQAFAVWNSESLYDQNPNALKIIKEWALEYRSLSDEIDDLAYRLEDENLWVEPDEDDQ